MQKNFTHEIELYAPEVFQTLLAHEVNRARRYKTPLALVHLAIETDPDRPEIQHSAEMFAINILDVQLRDTDISCRKGGEFLILMPGTDEPGGRNVCERLATLFNAPHQTYDRVSFEMTIYVGMTSLAGGASVSSGKLMQQAFTAMQHAQTNRLSTAVIFSEIS